jgi:hypothetical protein
VLRLTLAEFSVAVCNIFKLIDAELAQHFTMKLEASFWVDVITFYTPFD